MHMHIHMHIHNIPEHPRIIPCLLWFPFPHFLHIFLAMERLKPRNPRLAGLLARGGAAAGNFPGGVRSRQVTRQSTPEFFF